MGDAPAGDESAVDAGHLDEVVRFELQRNLAILEDILEIDTRLARHRLQRSRGAVDCLFWITAQTGLDDAFRLADEVSDILGEYYMANEQRATDQALARHDADRAATAAAAAPPHSEGG
jgi:hypothetical protein